MSKSPTKEYKCPTCDAVLTLLQGDGHDPKNGVMVWCNNKECSAAENVYGHGTTAKEAYVTACRKFNRAGTTTTAEEEEEKEGGAEDGNN